MSIGKEPYDEPYKTISSVRALMRERENSQISSLSLANIIYAGKLHKLKKAWSLIEDDPCFDKSSRQFLNHSQRYVDACRKIMRFQEIFDEFNLEELPLEDLYQYYLAIDENLPLDVHLSMFIPVLTYHTRY